MYDTRYPPTISTSRTGTRLHLPALLLALALVVAAAAAGCDGTPAGRVDAAPDLIAADTGGSSAEQGPAADLAAADQTAPDSGSRDLPPPQDASPTATSYLLWQSPGGFALTGPAIEVFGSGLIRFWKQTKGLSPHGTSGWDQVNMTSPGLVNGLFNLLAKVDFSKLPHKTSTQAECYPVLYWEKCASCTPTKLVHNKISGLKPEMTPVLQWFTANLSKLYEGDLPPDFCFGT